MFDYTIHKYWMTKLEKKILDDQNNNGKHIGI